MEEKKLQYVCCEAAEKGDKDSIDTLKMYLLEHVWNYFEVNPDSRHVSEVPEGIKERELKELKLLIRYLMSVTISGCLASFDMILEGKRNVASMNGIPEQKVINLRVPCEFPVPDMWIKKTVRLAISPLHLACWRLNHRLVEKLLSLGADPNQLAWETFENSYNDGNSGSNIESPQRDGDIGHASRLDSLRQVEGINFTSVFGFSPLMFIALALRSPPGKSLAEGKANRIIHAVANYDELDSPRPDLDLNGNCSEVEESAGKAVEACLKLLLSAGADPNLGQSHYLGFFNPLDIIVQPPIKLYYAPMMARANQTSGSLRQQNFEYFLPLIISAACALMYGGARLSPKFLRNFRWSLRGFDCFWSNRCSESLYNFVRILAHLGVYPDKKQIHKLENNRNIGPNYVPDSKEPTSCGEEEMHKFIADAVNIPAPEYLIIFILKWCSLDVLQLFVETARDIVENSEFEHKYLRDLIEVVVSEQLPSLKHLSRLAILKTLRTNNQFDKIESLPLPSPLIRGLKVIAPDV